MRTATTTFGHFHAVRFYKDADELCRIVAEFIGEGLVGLQPAIVIATSDHRDQIAAALQARSFDVPRLEAKGDLLFIDAEGALKAFMIDGMPNAARFRRSIVPLIQKISEGRPSRTIRAYGEMVDVLWKQGRTVAATRLEMLWNDLAKTHDFSLLCGYCMGSFYKDAELREISDQHTHLVAESGAPAPVN